MFNEKNVNLMMKKVEKSLTHTGKYKNASNLCVGVDLGTAFIVLVVLNEEKEPIACEMQFAQVLKDGLVVDYIGALQIVRELKEKLEARLNCTLERAAIAVPPGTSEGTCKTHKYVVEGAGMEVVATLDEPTAANAVLNIENGAVVDIGGGTTGISILKNGEVVYTADEPTGGTHVSLVLSGSFKISFEEAEALKKDTKRHREVFASVVPVFQKMGSIVKRHIEDYDVEDLYLVGGTCCLAGIEDIIEKETGVKTHKPENPFLITPTGIALNCF